MLGQRYSDDTAQRSSRFSWAIHEVTIVSDHDDRERLIQLLSSPDRPEVLGFVNAHAFNLAWSDAFTRSCFRSCTVLVRDGIGMQILYSALGLPAGQNMNGTDLIPEIVAKFAGKRVALFGTAEPFLSTAAEVLRGSAIDVVTTIDGFKSDEVYLEDAERTGPELIILAMGMPKQERVARLLSQHLRDPCLIICGGAILDFLSGRVQRAPRWMRRLHLEWAFRLAREPRRLFSRYVVGNILFLARVAIVRREVVNSAARELG
ncbi:MULTISPECIES: WecB/TagA/CpsF family glycosyltransferase [Microvirga]|uniref:WecB/TagA/CpsF family glycosyltransferase n=1 Tax=Microvirga TaxID=186650 RepID=UPI00211171F2|nr:MULTISPECIES: WecB/TagA/CpsF family glycosyltransferase [unclassified Microvirga]